MKHIVGFSGGIDSQACARWVLNRYPAEDVILTNSNAGGNEDPLTEEFLDWYSANVHPVVRIHAQVRDMWQTPGFVEVFKTKPGNEWAAELRSDDPLTFDIMILIKGRSPSRKAQFCTEILKLRPQRDWILQQFGPGGPYDGEAYCRYTGVRRDESDARKNAPIQQWDTWFDCDLFAPLADWTKQMCFDFVQAHGERVNELYTMGFERVGCAPCINSGKEDILNWATRRPQMIDKIRGWEQRSGRTYFAPRVPGMRTNNIDEVVAWAKTSRGGRQALLPVMHDRPACESKFGLCG